MTAMDTIALWKAVVSRKHGTRVSTRFITRLENKADIKRSLRCSLAKALQNLKEAYQRYYSLKKDADDLRKSWLKDLAAIQSKKTGGNQETIYQNLLLRERQRAAGRRLRRQLGKTQRGLSKASVKDGDETIELTTKEEIEDACHQENRSKFSQTNATPLMQG